MPNLHGRSFALARWKLREWLFGLGDAPPEHFAPSVARAMIAFAWATWFYRLVLFLGIAVLVYVFFFKVLGLLLFAVEIAWFILWPIRSELRVWQQLWPRIRILRRTRLSVFLLLLMLLLLALPWPGRITASAVLRPVDYWPIHSPIGARVESLHWAHGDVATEGSPLVTLQVPELAGREQVLSVRLGHQRQQAAIAGFDDEMRKRWRVAEQTLATTQAEWKGAQAERSQFQPRAPYVGRFFLADPDLAAGQWVSKKEQLGVLVREGSAWCVETWLEEDDVGRVQVGQLASFWVDSMTGQMLQLKVLSIDQDAARNLPLRELASQQGGHVVTREKNGMLVPERAVYRVMLEPQQLSKDMLDFSSRGKLVIHADWGIPIARYMRHIMSVLVRETGF
jgi:putative peptide zinc metalloprotease protein